MELTKNRNWSKNNCTHNKMLNCIPVISACAYHSSNHASLFDRSIQLMTDHSLSLINFFIPLLISQLGVNIWKLSLD